MSRLAEALAAALPEEARTGHDPVRWTVGGAVPEAVAAPSSVEEVQTLLRVAGEAGVGVVPLGGRTDPGPEAPSGPFVALSTLRLEGVEEHEPADLTVTVRAGTSLASLAGILEPAGQWVPVDPPFAPRKTVGGLVAGGAAGPLGMAYGAPRDHVLGLTVVTGDGRLLRLGGKVMKNVAGFDLVKLMVGSRGTLGVIVAATFRLFPRPAAERVVVLTSSKPGDLLAAAREVATAPVVPASAVLVSPSPVGSASEGALVVRVQGTPSTVDAEIGRLLGSRRSQADELAGVDAARVLDAVRDHGAGHPLTLRCAGLPGRMADTLAALREAVPNASLAVDVMAGRVRAGVPEGPAADAEALRLLRRRLEASGGTLVLERADPALMRDVEPYGAAGRVAALAAGLRARFDPRGILSPGRFVS